ncbi:MAG: MarC family protein [Gemmataceae bacterium]
MTILAAALLLFLVMDPLGNIPFFLTALKRVDPRRQNVVVVRELLIALVALVLFLFAGQHILEALHISEPALTLSGGVILFLIALRMIFPSAERPLQEAVEGEPFIVPLAIPYVAGPSALATELLLMSREPERWPDWLLALVVAWGASSVILFFSSRLRRYLGPKGLIAVERLMGMVLITVSIQMLLNGAKVAWREMGGPSNAGAGNAALVAGQGALFEDLVQQILADRFEELAADAPGLVQFLGGVLNSRMQTIRSRLPRHADADHDLLADIERFRHVQADAVLGEVVDEGVEGDVLIGKLDAADGGKVAAEAARLAAFETAQFAAK